LGTPDANAQPAKNTSEKIVKHIDGLPTLPIVALKIVG